MACIRLLDLFHLVPRSIVKANTIAKCPQFVHSTIAKCLGIPENNVRVITRRVGGGFGGKGAKSMAAAASCALAAHKLQRPVRMYLNPKTDMIMVGGRHPMKITYNVGFKNNGKITALHLEILVDAGIYPDVSAIMPYNIAGTLKKYDWGALSFDINLCRTNHPSRSAMRAPGDLQGSFITEVIIENVAATLSMEVDSVRSINLHTYTSLKKFYDDSCGEPLEYTMPLIWNKLAVSANYELRVNKVKEFNSTNIWKKRGISRVPVLYDLNVVKQMAAFALGTIQCDGSGSLLDKVRVVQADSLSLIQGGLTAGSTTSESSCEAVRLSCNILVERLKPIKNKLQEEIGSIKWENLILQAYMQAVNISASSYFVRSKNSMKYSNYGAAVSEIEGSFIQGLGFFILEEYETNLDGLVLQDGTWNYKIPTIDTIPQLSSKASGEPPLLLAASVHCATRSAVKEARKQLLSWSNSDDGSDSKWLVIHFYKSSFYLGCPDL
ncbi:unnamed protein product [Trifolium pratense]|uniref:Uncharacterized protein n=1 Tax=Trifolium pratense TaxID=57577 RepID=A0ACB0KBU7_TRIPR|nr:unnamed protein product [Trifolium pratense]